MLPLQFVQQQFRDSTHTDTNSLNQALLTKPELLDYVALAYGANQTHKQGYGNMHSLLQYLCSGSKTTGMQGSYKPIGDREVEWALMGQYLKKMTIVGTVTPNALVGLGHTTFEVPLEDKYFFRGEVCRFEDDTLARVEEEPRPQGSHWCYTFKIVSANAADTVAGYALEIGRSVASSHSLFGEGSQGGGAKSATPMRFRNTISTTKTNWGMTGDALNQVLEIKIPTSDGKQGKSLWVYYQEAEAYRQHMRHVENLLWTSRSNRLPDGSVPNFDSNGQPIYSGAGIDEQIKGINTFTTSQLTSYMLRDMAYELKNKSYNAETKEIMLITGTGGARHFHYAIQKDTQFMPIVADDIYISKIGKAELSFGGTFTRYQGPGVTFTLCTHPAFDDPNTFNAMSSEGYTKQSYKMYFLDFGNVGGEPNIQLLTRGKDGSNRALDRWITAGGVVPKGMGLDNPTSLRSHGQDSFEVWIQSQVGVVIRNPLSCGMIEIIVD